MTDSKKKYDDSIFQLEMGWSAPGATQAVTSTGDLVGLFYADNPIDVTAIEFTVTTALSGTGSLTFVDGSNNIVATLALTSGTAAGTMLRTRTITDSDGLIALETGNFTVATACDAGAGIPSIKYKEKFNPEA